MIGRDNVGGKQNLYLSSKTHDMRKLFLFESQRDGAYLGHYLAERFQVVDKYRVRYFGVDVGKSETSSGSDQWGEFKKRAVVVESVVNGVDDSFFCAEVDGNAAIGNS